MTSARKIDRLLLEYGASHQNKTNKFIHWICVPAIMFSLLGLLYVIPFPSEKSLLFNWAAVFIGLALVYYFTLSKAMFLGFIVVGGGFVIGNHYLYNILTDNHLWFSVALFVLAWIGQFIGHKIEGKKPSFFKDLQFLLIGPAWLLSFIFNKIGLKY